MAKNGQLSPLYTSLTRCIACRSRPQLDTQNTLRDALVWNGSVWIAVKHGEKKCRTCHGHFRINYQSKIGKKINTLKEADDNQVMLMNDDIGFTIGYLRQYWNRVCRCGVSAEGKRILFY